MAGKQASGRRRGLVLGIVLLLLLCLLTTCVVVAQSSRYTGDQPEPADTPRRASIGGTGDPTTASPTPSESRPRAAPWRKVHWHAAVRTNQIIGIRYPPKPPPRKARADPLRAGIALLAALDSTNPVAWKPGSNPLRAYMTARLDRIYTPTKKGQGAVHDGPVKLPKGGTATYRFYCYVPDGYTATKVTVACGYHVRVRRASGKLYRQDTSPQQQLTVKRADDGWRVARIGSATPAGD